MDIDAICIENANKVFFFSVPNCTYCDVLKEELEALEVPFVKVIIDKDDVSAKTALVEKTKQRTFPQLFFGSRFIGGFDQFRRLLMTNQVSDALAPLGLKCKENDF